MTTGQRLAFLAKTGGTAKALLLLIGAGATTGAALVDYSKIPSATALQHLLAEAVAQGRVRVRIGTLEPAQVSARVVSVLFAQQLCEIDASDLEGHIGAMELARVAGYIPVLVGSEEQLPRLSAQHAVDLSTDFFNVELFANSQVRTGADIVGELA